jgi:hypothetical protein
MRRISRRQLPAGRSRNLERAYFLQAANPAAVSLICGNNFFRGKKSDASPFNR